MARENWDVITNRLVLLNTKWEYWKQLFGTEETVTLLNHLAPSCFALIQESMLFDVIASTARLLDQMGNRHQPNLVIETLLGDLSAGSAKDSIAADLANIKTAAETVGKIRHKIVAHEDKNVATGLMTLTPADTAMIDGLITSINTLMRQMEEVAGIPTHTYRAVDVKGSGKTILWLLEQAHPRLVAAMSSVNGKRAAEVPDVDHLGVIYVRYPH